MGIQGSGEDCVVCCDLPGGDVSGTRMVKGKDSRGCVEARGRNQLQGKVGEEEQPAEKPAG